MSASLNNSLLINHLLIQVFICTYRVLGSLGKHSSPTYSRSVTGAKYVSKGLKKDFYRHGGIWDGPFKMKGISGGGRTEKWWTVVSPLCGVGSIEKKREEKGEAG